MILKIVIADNAASVCHNCLYFKIVIPSEVCCIVKGFQYISVQVITANLRANDGINLTASIASKFHLFLVGNNTFCFACSNIIAVVSLIIVEVAPVVGICGNRIEIGNAVHNASLMNHSVIIALIICIDKFKISIRVCLCNCFGFNYAFGCNRSIRFCNRCSSFNVIHIHHGFDRISVCGLVSASGKRH